MKATCSLSPRMLLHVNFLGLPSVIVSFCYITNYHKFSRLKWVILVSVCQELSSHTGDSSSLMRSQWSCQLGRWLLVASVVVEDQLLRWLTHTAAVWRPQFLTMWAQLEGGMLRHGSRTNDPREKEGSPRHFFHIWEEQFSKSSPSSGWRKLNSTFWREQCQSLCRQISKPALVWQTYLCSRDR